MALSLGGLWRYPVKSMAGEAVHRAELTELGVPGDRLVWVRGPEGVRTARRQHRLLGLHGTLSPRGIRAFTNIIETTVRAPTTSFSKGRCCVG